MGDHEIREVPDVPPVAGEHLEESAALDTAIALTSLGVTAGVGAAQIGYARASLRAQSRSAEVQADTVADMRQEFHDEMRALRFEQGGYEALDAYDLGREPLDAYGGYHSFDIE